MIVHSVAAGMVMMAEPLQHCLEAIRAARAEADAQEQAEPAPVLLFSPIGTTLKHEVVAHWAQSRGAILLCGRYEGIDQRFIDTHVTHQLSLGISYSPAVNWQPWCCLTP